jgi:hypothetical protein
MNEVMPLRPAPAERQNAIDDMAHLGRGAIAQRAQIGNQADVPKKERHRGVGRDGEKVPSQRAIGAEARTAE